MEAGQMICFNLHGDKVFPKMMQGCPWEAK